VLVHSFEEVISYADIECTGFIGHDVHIELIHVHYCKDNLIGKPDASLRSA